MPFSSVIARGPFAAIAGGTIGVVRPTTTCATRGAAIRHPTAIRAYFPRPTGRTPAASPTIELVQRSHDSADDPRRIADAIEVRDPELLRRIEDGDRHLHDRHRGGDGAKDHLGFESVPFGARPERERRAHGVAAETALRVGE